LQEEVDDQPMTKTKPIKATDCTASLVPDFCQLWQRHTKPQQCGDKNEEFNHNDICLAKNRKRFC
jgi:hypothetical protein